MSRQRFVRLFSPGLVALLAVTGCGDTTKTDPKTKTPSKQQAKHPAHGPNDGHLFELRTEGEGGKSLHVEFFEDEKAKKLVAVLLGEDKKQEVQSAAAEATIEVTTGTEEKPFTLKAEAKDGKASRFSSADKAVLKAVEAKDAKIKFQVAVDGKTYTVEAEHILH